MEESLKIHRCLFTFKYPTNLGIALAPIKFSMEKIVRLGFNKIKRNAACESLPEPRKTETPGLFLIEFYAEKGVVSGMELDLIKEVERYTRGHRLPRVDANKLNVLKSVGVEWSFEELEEWKNA